MGQRRSPGWGRRHHQFGGKRIEPLKRRFETLKGQTPRGLTPLGFTLLELIIVTILLAILTAFAAPQLKNSFQNLQLTMTAQKLVSLARYARSQAIVTQKVVQFHLDPDERRAELKTPTPQSDGASIEWQIHPKNRPIALPMGIKIESEGMGSGGVEILFFPDGSATSAELLLSDASGSQRSITVSGPSGRAEMKQEHEEE